MSYRYFLLFLMMPAIATPLSAVFPSITFMISMAEAGGMPSSRPFMIFTMACAALRMSLNGPLPCIDA